jgi:hypothetical protein
MAVKVYLVAPGCSSPMRRLTQRLVTLTSLTVAASDGYRRPVVARRCPSDCIRGGEDIAMRDVLRRFRGLLRAQCLDGIDFRGTRGGQPDGGGRFPLRESPRPGLSTRRGVR